VSLRKPSNDFVALVTNTFAALRAATEIDGWVLTRCVGDYEGVLLSGAHPSALRGVPPADRRVHHRLVARPVVDGERLFGNLVGYVTQRNADPERVAHLAQRADACSGVIDLLATSLGDSLRDERMRHHVARAEERRAYPERDPLTGLFDRSAWLRLSEREAKRLAAFEDPACVAVLRVAVTPSPDTGGFEAVQELLREVAHQLRQLAGPSGLTARIGQETFAWLSLRGDAEHVAAQLGERMQDFTPQVRFGVASRTIGERGLDSVTERATPEHEAPHLALAR
jgi:GGDEF domain-containing protein